VLIPAIGALKGNLMPMMANMGIDIAGEAAGTTPPGRWSGGWDTSATDRSAPSSRRPERRPGGPINAVAWSAMGWSCPWGRWSLPRCINQHMAAATSPIW